MLSFANLQEYLRFKAHQDHEVVSSSPFTLFFHSTHADSESNYAIPDASEESEHQKGLRGLQLLFEEHARTPSLQFIEEAFPHLAPILISSGWPEKDRSSVMICTPETYQSAPEVLGLMITTLSSESTLEEIREGLDTNAWGFDPQAPQTTLQEAEEFRQTLILSRAFTVHMNEQPVGAGMFTEISNGWTELAGITTLKPLRRRGVATALTAYMTQRAFLQGATHIFLIAADEQASRVYERVGFRRFATQVIYEVSASQTL